MGPLKWAISIHKGVPQYLRKRGGFHFPSPSTLPRGYSHLRLSFPPREIHARDSTLRALTMSLRKPHPVTLDDLIIKIVIVSTERLLERLSKLSEEID